MYAETLRVAAALGVFVTAAEFCGVEALDCVADALPVGVTDGVAVLVSVGPAPKLRPSSSNAT
jgi:hypothetical protein